MKKDLSQGRRLFQNKNVDNENIDCEKAFEIEEKIQKDNASPHEIFLFSEHLRNCKKCSL